MSKRRPWQWFIVSTLVILVDQLTKHWALTHLEPSIEQAICPWFNFTLGFNTGAAFSFLNEAGPWHHYFFALFSLAMSAALMIWILRISPQERGQLAGISLILGGALGNFIDRLHYGHVIDFIDVYYRHYHWPAFNVADSAIVVGAILLMICLKETRDK